MATEYEIDDILVERFANGNGTIFAGAGISLSSRLPSWDDLIVPMRKDLGREAHTRASAQDIAELYEAKHGRAVMIKHLRERLGDVRSQLTRTHELIVQLPVNRIYTTNYDTLLEQASSKLQINRNVIYNASQVGFSDNSQLSIVKLHGDLNDTESVVITANDYYSYFTRNPAVADLLKVELQTHTVLFIGYSFRDASLGMILGKVSAQLGKGHPPWYALQLQPGAVSMEAMKARGVKVIPLDIKSGTPEAVAGVQDWLESFQRALNRRDRRVRRQPGVGENGDAHSLPPFKRSTFGKATHERIETGLRSDFRVIVVKGEPGIGKTQQVASCVADHLAPQNTMLLEYSFDRVIWIRKEADETGTARLERIFAAITASLPSAVAGSGSPQDTEKPRDKVNRLLQENRVIVVIEDLEAQATAVKEWLEDPGQFANPRSRIIVTTREAVVAGFVVEVPPLLLAEDASFVDEAASAMMLRRHLAGKPPTQEIFAAGQGNPQAILLALGLLNGSRQRDILQTLDDSANKKASRRLPGDRNGGIDAQDTPRPWIGDVFKTLIDAAVKRLDTETKSLLRVMLLFPAKQMLPESIVTDVMVIDPECGHGGNGAATVPHWAENAMNRAAAYNLVERDRARGTLMMPSIPWEMLRAHLAPNLVARDYHLLAGQLLGFLRRPNVMCRDEIPDPYWNTLLRDEMQKIDPLWPVIRHVMRKLGHDPLIVDFVMLLCHYMDNRSYNPDRILFSKAALDSGNHDQRRRALLLIDALGWTYVEEGRREEAHQAIDDGLNGLPFEGNEDLYAVAETFRARLASEEHDFVHAEAAIEKAFEHGAKMDDAAGRNDARTHIDATRRPWIWTRMYMLRGDVRLMQHNPDAVAGGGGNGLSRRPPEASYARKALNDYENAAWLTERYGGEGNAYQTGPRIGLALLQTGVPADIGRAEKIFERLAGGVPMSLGYLYGEYGLAMIKAKKKANHEALDHLRRLQRKLAPRLSSSNTLLRLISQSCDKVEADMEAARH